MSDDTAAAPPSAPTLELFLSRLAQTETGTYGNLETEEHQHLYCTLEPPWHENARDISCIPAGRYRIERQYSPEHHRVLFWVRGVPDRDDVEIHIGCLFPRDTKGCVLLGMSFGPVDYADGKPNAKGFGLLESHRAFDAFMAAMEGIDAAWLTITNPSENPADFPPAA